MRGIYVVISGEGVGTEDDLRRELRKVFRDDDSLRCAVPWPELGMIEQGSPNRFRSGDGMGSCVHADPKAKSVRILTDRFASKPLYLRSMDKLLAVSSLVAPILAPEKTQWNWRYIESFLRWGVCPTPEDTPFEGIKALAPFADTQVTNVGPEHCTLTYDSWGEWKPTLANDLLGLVRAAVERACAVMVEPTVLVNRTIGDAIVAALAGERPEYTSVLMAPAPESYTLELKGVETIHLALAPVEHDDLALMIERPVTPWDEWWYAVLRAAKRAGHEAAISGFGAREVFGGGFQTWLYDVGRSAVTCDLPGLYLPALTKMADRLGVDLAFPFLDKAVVEAALALPYDQRSRQQALRFAALKLLPEKLWKYRDPVRWTVPEKRVEYLERFARVFDKYTTDTLGKLR